MLYASKVKYHMPIGIWFIGIFSDLTTRDFQHRFYCSLTSAYIILPPNISKPFSQYNNLIVVYVPHLMVLYWCDHGVGCLLLETEHSPLQPRCYGTKFQAGWKKLPVSRPSRWALNPISLAVTYHTDSSAICKVSLITSSGFWPYAFNRIKPDSPLTPYPHHIH
jgi:hypothetical protein